MFEHGYEDKAYFVVDSEDKITLNDLMGWNSNVKIKLKFDERSKDYRKLCIESKLFRIEDIYHIHRKYVSDLLYKKNMIEKPIMSDVIKYL